MASIVENEKGFKVIKLSLEEAKSLNWGISEGMYINSVSGHDERDTIVGNLTGKGIDTIYVYQESHYPELKEDGQYN